MRTSTQKKPRFIVFNKLLVLYLYLEIEKEFIYYLRFNKKIKGFHYYLMIPIYEHKYFIVLSIYVTYIIFIFL
jgi:hypothetical protein